MPAAYEHRRSTPPEWSQLLPKAAEITAGSTEDVSLKEYRDLYAAAASLGNEQLESNRYYGTGLVLCSFSRLLDKPDNRQIVVTKAAKGIAAASARDHSPALYGTYRGIRLIDLCDDNVRPAADSLITTMSSTVDPASLLLANAFASVYQRRTTLKGGAHLDDVVIEALYQGRPLTEQNIARNSLAGAMSIFRRAIEGYRTPDAYDLDDVNPVISDLVDTDTLDMDALQKPARQAASLRGDEFASGILDELLYSKAPGELTFRRHALPAQPPAINRTGDITAPLHTTRLTCPAIQVVGAIPQVLGIMPAVLKRAQAEAVSKSMQTFG